MKRITKTNSAHAPPPLLFGPYMPPACRKGDWIADELLGLVEVFGWTIAPLSWPRVRQKGPACPVLTERLAEAVRRESETAVAHWWGVSRDQVRRWRRQLGVEPHTEGSRQLLSANNRAMPAERRERCVAAMSAPQARVKAAETRRGRPAHPATRAALLRGARKPRSKEWGAEANARMLAGKARKAAQKAEKP